jgi:hypothetical protein
VIDSVRNIKALEIVGGHSIRIKLSNMISNVVVLPVVGMMLSGGHIEQSSLSVILSVYAVVLLLQ